MGVPSIRRLSRNRRFYAGKRWSPHGPHATAQNRREYVIQQPNPGCAEFFALPIMGFAIAMSPIRRHGSTQSFLTCGYRDVVTVEDDSDEMEGTNQINDLSHAFPAKHGFT